jgi:hypothetical protein
MNLHSLRKHYRKDKNKWVPKRSFKTQDEVKEKLGFNLDKCLIYQCDVCSALHVSELRKYK